MIFKRIFLFLLVIAQLMLVLEMDAQKNEHALAQLVKNLPQRELPFTDSISSPETGKPIPLKEVDELGFLSVYEVDTIYLLYKVSISQKFYTIALGFKRGNVIKHMLITLDKNDYKPIYSIDIAERDQEKDFPELQTTIHQRGFSLINMPDASRKNYKHYLFTHEGTFIAKQWKSWRTLIQEGSLVDVRPVKNKQGALVTNSKGEVIDTIAYAEDVYIIKYDATKGNALVARSYTLYLDDLQVLHDSTNFGYVSTNHLYKSNGFNYSSSQYVEAADDPAYLYYYTHSLAIRDPFTGVTDLDIREFIEIERVEWNDYKDRIFVAEDSMVNSFFFPYQEGDVLLAFDNGTSWNLKDTTYHNMEYQPTNHYQLVENNKFKNHYLIYNSFFESYQFLLFHKQTADTTGVFQGYPFVSPRRNYVVCFDTPYTYGKEVAYLELQTLNGKHYRHALSARFANWNVPRIKRIYWLSNTEFILKVKPVEDAYSKEEDTAYFYLKFTIMI
jgi:hypothetical protein